MPVEEAAVPVAVLDMDIVIVPDADVMFMAESVPPVPAVTLGVVLFDADLAEATNFSIVLPVVGALIAPTIPDWQCDACEQ